MSFTRDRHAPSAGGPSAYTGGFIGGATSIPSAPPVFTDLPMPTSPMGFQTGVELGGGGGGFTSEDRLLLKLIYYQQQSLQAQLNSILSWAEQTNARLGTLEARVATVRASSSVSYTDHTRHEPAPSSLHAQRPPEASRWTAGTPAIPQNVSTTSNNTTSEQRSCTPPGASPVANRASTASGAQRLQTSSAALDNSLEGVAPPWDPRNREPIAGTTTSHSATNVDVSFRSSHATHLGRSENPLLHSRHSSLTGAGGRVGQQTSLLSQSGLGGDAGRVSRLPSTQNSSLLAVEAGDTVNRGHTTHEDASRRAPWRVPSSASGAAAVPLVSAPAGQRDTSDPTIIIAEREVPAYRRVPASYTTTTSIGGGGLADPPPSGTPSARSTTVESSRDPLLRGTSARHQRATPAAENEMNPTTTTTAPVAKVGSPPSGAGAGESRHVERVATRAPVARTQHEYADMDSLSDGYGSYESRQYIQNIGLL